MYRKQSVHVIECRKQLLSCHALICFSVMHILTSLIPSLNVCPVHVLPCCFINHLTNTGLCVMLLCANVPVLSQSLLEELASKESQLHRLREKAQQLWDGHTAGKGFVHRVSQLSAQYLALSNLTKVTSHLSARWLPIPGAAGVDRLCVHIGLCPKP